MKSRNSVVGITVDQVAAVIRPHASFYVFRSPAYQTVILQDLARIWQGHHETVLDFGGGTGVMAEAVQSLLPVGTVTTVDIIDRFYPTLTVKTEIYDGHNLPFPTKSFDAATVNNVIHHVPPVKRSDLMAELCRVVRGPIYIKDHIASSPADHFRLSVLDAMGNIPFGGMVSAVYLNMHEWHDLAESCGCQIGAIVCGRYRGGLQAVIFPNRLEIVLRFDRA